MSEQEVTFVLVLSKLCNLRCRYCYEFPDLANKARMTLEQLNQLFVHVAAHYHNNEPLRIKFAWQGGEPLLIPPEYYWQAFEQQRSAFASSPHTITNVIQSNLTVLDDDRIALLRQCFDGVGFSIDLFGTLRVNKFGVSLEQRTIENIHRLIEAGIAVGGITVLSKENLNHIPEIYDFYRNLGIPFRLLPLHKGPFPSNQNIEITAQETLRTFCELADLWFEDHAFVQVDPLSEYIAGILAKHTLGSAERRYNKEKWEYIFIVDVDGSIGGVNNLLDSAFSYGNIFETPLTTILASRAHQLAVTAARERVLTSCTGCPFYQTACSGYPMAEGDKEFTERDEYGALQCTFTRGIFEHIEHRLLQAGYIHNRDEPAREISQPSFPVSTK